MWLERAAVQSPTRCHFARASHRLPFIAVTCNTHWKLCLKSWDGFQIPLPFSRCELILNKPLLVPRNAEADEREELRKELEASLNDSSMD